MTIPCVVIDAGARYGLHPTWAELRGLVDFHLFEMDEVEAARLDLKYLNDERIHVYPIALFREDTNLTFQVHQHRALNSVFATNPELLSRNNYMLREFSEVERRTTVARSIDSIFAGKEVHFLKLDVEGAEFDLLKGASHALETTILGVRSEVLFAPIFEGGAQFGDIHSYLLDRGFELLNLDYTGAGNQAGRFSLPVRFGKLLSSDAVWVVNNERLFAAGGEGTLHDLIRFSLFLMNNGATDIAVETLIRAVTREGVSLAPVKSDPLFRELRRKILLLFKTLLTFPMLLEADITEAYRTIFDEEFPLMNRFYETLD
jgi:FkbM family methyltransferase